LYKLADGVRVEPLGGNWAAFSPLSGETQLLNTEASAVLELLADGAMGEAQIAQNLARESGNDPAEVGEALRHVWGQLLAAGLIEPSTLPEHNAG